MNIVVYSESGMKPFQEPERQIVAYKIFISYRRDDSSGYAGRLHDYLVQAFGQDSIFMDISAIKPGRNFSDAINKAVGDCEVLLAIIGPRWFSITDDKGARRIARDNDYVRLEIAAALEQELLVIPILVQKAYMPPIPLLPENLKQLGYCHAVELSDSRWEYDVNQLLSTLKTRLNTNLYPYKFLDFFTAEDRNLFYGRSDEIWKLQQEIKKSRLVVLYGRSGVGKTSLLRAGVIPKLETDGYLCLYVRFGYDPEWSIKKELLGLRGMLDNGIGFPDANLPLSRFVVETTKQLSNPLVLVIDQFEEFELLLSKVVRRAFAKTLGEIFHIDTGTVKIVASIREDFLGVLDELRPNVPNPLENYFRLVNLGRDGAARAIVEPASFRNLTYMSDALEMLLAGLEENSGAHDNIFPPHLQIVCYRILEALPENVETISASFINQLGGVEKLIGDYLQSALATLQSTDQEAARELLKQMISSSGTKMLRRAEDFSSLENTTDLLDILIERRLVRRISENNNIYFELSHDQLADLVSAWVNIQEQQAKEITEMLTQEVANQVYCNQRGDTYYIEISKIQRVYEQRENLYLHITDEMQRLLLLSAFFYGANVGKDAPEFLHLGYWLNQSKNDNKIVEIIYQLIMESDNFQQYVFLLHKDVNYIRVKVRERLLLRFRPVFEARQPNRIKAAYLYFAFRRDLTFRNLLKATWNIFLLDIVPRFAKSAPKALVGLIVLAVFVAIASGLGIWGGRFLCNLNLLQPSSFVCEALDDKPTMVEPLEHKLMLIPEGSFISGTDQTESTVGLDAYYIDKYEVTNIQYRQCVDADVCHSPVNSIFDMPEYDQYPVTNISLDDAQVYCDWIGGYIPTEMQWEKAARGTNGFIYPWGNDALSDGQANICDIQCSEALRVESIDDGYSQAAPVGSYPTGASPFGVEDMVGNVWEWTSAGSAMGGSWSNDRRLNKATSRIELPADARNSNLGFRCANDSP